MAGQKNNDSALLARLDERTQNFAGTLDKLQRTHEDGVQRLLGALQTHAGENEKDFDKHDGRLKRLENWRWYIIGAGGALAFIGWVFK